MIINKAIIFDIYDHFTINLANGFSMNPIDEEMDELVKNVPGMSSFLRYRDLPSFCRGQDNSSCIDLEQLFSGEQNRNKNANGIILNTFEDLEGPILTKIQSQYSRFTPLAHYKHT